MKSCVFTKKAVFEDLGQKVPGLKLGASKDFSLWNLSLNSTLSLVISIHNINLYVSCIGWYICFTCKRYDTSSITIRSRRVVATLLRKKDGHANERLQGDLENPSCNLFYMLQLEKCPRSNILSRTKVRTEASNQTSNIPRRNGTKATPDTSWPTRWRRFAGQLHSDHGLAFVESV